LSTLVEIIGKSDHVGTLGCWHWEITVKEIKFKILENFVCMSLVISVVDIVIVLFVILGLVRGGRLEGVCQMPGQK
jgi:hypothetical protein